ncbi:MAG TPA: MarR family transcriptional regulator [Fibrobacteria bacterium]|mgnify:CR=1 FL=1|nr:MarR family transcriptional regulator [Fibrobacteria bacterium]HOX50740.1 MarR family transcriptional regulator [Fibrobacteria bacterium]
MEQLSTSKKSHPSRIHDRRQTHLLRELMELHQDLMSRFAQRTGSTPARFALLRLLAVSEEGLGTLELSRRLGIDAAAVTRQLQSLEADALVERIPDAKDARRNRARLSGKGFSTFTAIHEQAHALEKEMDRLVGAQAMASATDTLATIRKWLEQSSTGANA